MPTVFPSSTSRDLPEYRAAVLEACRSLHLAVATMEDFPAMGVGATKGSLAQLDQCDVYLGVFAHRYGYVEPGHACSVTEAEYDHAKARGLECLCFFVAEGVAWPEDRVERDALPRLEALKRRIQGEQIVRWFRNPDDLKHEAFRALLDWLERTGRRPRGPRQVPPPPADFVGRGDDLAALLAGFEGGATIFGARGLGGVGKTTLALALAQRLAPRFPDGQLYLDLRGVGDSPLPWRDVAGHVVRSYLPDERLPDGDDALRGLYRTVLHGKRALLLLDNAADAGQVEPLRPPEGCALLVTSRRRFTLPGLLARDLDALPPADAAALLRSIAPRVGAAAEEIAALCGRLPLALRLAGALLAERDDLAPERYLVRLRAARLSERSGLAEVAAALRLSEEALPEGVRARWRELAVLVGGFEGGWAAGVWGVDEETADDWLGALRRNSLLEWGKEARLYRLHDLVREYAAAGLVPEERLEAERRHATYFEGVLREANDLYLSDREGVVAAVGRFDRAWANAEAAQAWAWGRQGNAEAQRLCVALPGAAVSLLSLRRHPRERVTWLEAALQAALALGDRRGECRALNGLGAAHHALGQPGRAAELYQQSLAVACEAGNRGGVGIALNGLGAAHHALGQPGRAAELYEQATVVFREVGDRRGVGTALNGLGAAYHALGQPGRAAELYQQSLAVAREAGDRRGEGTALGNLGATHAALDQPEQAIDLYRQQLAISQEIGDRRGKVTASWNLGLALVKLGRVAEAVPLMEVYVHFQREIGHTAADEYAVHVADVRRSLAGEVPPPAP